MVTGSRSAAWPVFKAFPFQQVSMFTGIVEGTARVTSVEEDDGRRIELESSLLEDVDTGGSVCVSGACLTVEELTTRGAVFFVSRETLDRTWFSGMAGGDTVNLETPVAAGESMGGHFVQGHVDTTAELLEIKKDGGDRVVDVKLPGEISAHVVEKGFVAVEGISLTVSGIDDSSFQVNIVPETWRETSLSQKDEGDKVNLEADILAKYVDKAGE